MQLEPHESSYTMVYHHFNAWYKARLFENVVQAVISFPSIRAFLVAVKNVHGNDVTGRHPTDRGRQTTKPSLLTASHGRLE